MHTSLAAQKAKARMRARAKARAPAAANDNVIPFEPPEPLALTSEYVIIDDTDDAPFEPPPADDILGLSECDEEETIFVAVEPAALAAEGDEQAEAEPPLLEDDAPFDPPEFDDEPVFSAPASVQLDLIAPPRKPEPPKPLTPREEAPARERPLPAISIYASWDRAEAESLLRELAADPRLMRADMTIARGGLDAAAAHCVSHEPPDLLILDTTLEGKSMLASLDRVRAAAPRAVIVVLGGVNDIGLLRDLAARGVADYIVPPAKAAGIARSLCALFANADGARVIAVVGARGGVGASTIAQNIAWSIAERQQCRTTLADFDLSFGSAGFTLQQTAPASIADIIKAGDEAGEVLTRALIKLTPRLQLICAPDRVEPADVDIEAFERTLAEVRRASSYVVLDLPHLWAPWVRQALRCADDIVIVCGPDLASLRNTDNMLKLLRSERDKPSAPNVVLSMVGVLKRPEIPLKDFAEAICVQPAAVFAFEPELFCRAAENGEMIYETLPDAKAALQLDTLASLLTGREPVAKPERRARSAPQQAPVAPPLSPAAEATPPEAAESAPDIEPLVLDQVAPAPAAHPARRAARTGFLALQALPPRSPSRSSGLVRMTLAAVALAFACAWDVQHYRAGGGAAAPPASVELNAWRV